MASSIPRSAHEPLSTSFLREVQGRVIDTRPGPWDLHASDNGEAPGFGPFSYVEAWDDTELLPAIEFCRHARTDVPALLGEISRLRGKVRQLEGQLDQQQRAPRLSSPGGRRA
ncbi:hypothetical protein ACWGI0_00305 [Streptomyces sp. NPDC054802]